MNDMAAGPVPRELLGTLPGLEIFRRLIAGELPPPPFSVTTGIYLIEVAEGRVVFEGEPSERFLNPLGTVHGGWAAALLDSAMGCAVHTRLPVGQIFTTVEMKVNFVRPIMPDAPRLRCEGRVLHFGGRIATSDATIIDPGTGKMFAHGSETCLIMEARP
jgi:uncharacterized protein (TIGR00369 family)